MQKEASARIKINKLLENSGWRFFEDENGTANIDLEPGIKLHEVGNDFENTRQGYIDYLLLDSEKNPICVLEAKSEKKHPLDGKQQARDYADNAKVRYIILSNGNIHYLWDKEQGNPTPISVYPTPESLTSRTQFKIDPPALLNEDITDDFLVISKVPEYKTHPDYINEGTRDAFNNVHKLKFLRPYQIKAIQTLQESVKEGKNRFLFEMATGTGKTTTCAAIMRLYLKTKNARRILFLVDRLELETQAANELNTILNPDYQAVIFKENKSSWHSGEIVVTTIQSIMHDNKYLKIFSPTDFDLIISDEAHRTINGEGSSRQVFDFFIGHKLGLTATPKDYLKNLNFQEEDPRDLERRNLLSTYKTFGCENGKPTFSYSLLDGVNEGYLINPTVLDCRTEITTQLLADEGYKILVDMDSDDTNTSKPSVQTEKIYKHTDFEKKFFSDQTNIQFALTFFQHGLKDPISNEIGKTLMFCVSQAHARKMETILNEIASRLFPGKYNSDFAMRITSVVDGAQKYTQNFTDRSNNLNGRSRWLEGYKTSKTRVCITVGMMTTGYDCTDLLNICLLRPIFSPTDFVQIKGRGTRKYTFEHKTEKSPKQKYFLFDFFGNCEFFEEKFDYDQKLELPTISRQIGGTGITGTTAGAGFIGEYISNIEDKLKTLEKIELGKAGMKLDRELYKNSFEQRIANIQETPEMQELITAGDIELIEAIVKERIFDKPEEYLNLEKLRKAYPSDRKLSLRDIIEHVLLGKKIPTAEDKANELFERFKTATENEIPAESFYFIKEFFTLYCIDEKFKTAVDSNSYGEYMSDPYMQELIKETGPFRAIIPQFINNQI